MPRVVYICGYDGKVCEKYKVRLNDDGEVVDQQINCTMADCDRCGFIGNPWVRLEICEERRPAWTNR